MRKLDKKLVNETVQLLNSKYGLGIEVSYLVYKLYGNSKESHNLCEYLKDVKKYKGTNILENFDKLVVNYHLNNL
jgi:hypothetical protein